MIKLSDLENRVYRDKECERFEYVLKTDKHECDLCMYFKRDIENSQSTWEVFTKFDRTSTSDTQVYNFCLEMPANNMSLVLICETGLRYMQMIIKQEIQKKSLIDFCIGDLIRGAE